MVKKITGSTPTKPGTAATGVKSNQAVQGARVDAVQTVGSLTQSPQAAKVRRPTRAMSAEEREHLFQLVEEEADKIFGEGNIPESRRQSVKNSVKMAIEASIISEDD